MFLFVQNQALQANKQLKGIEHMMEQLKDANDQLHTVKEAFVTHKKQEVMHLCFYFHRNNADFGVMTLELCQQSFTECLQCIVLYL